MSIKNTPKQSNKSFKHKKGFKRLIPKTKLGWFFVICAVIVIGLTIYSIIVINNRPKILTKDQAKEFLQKQANDINLPGEVVYEDTGDGGCNTAGLIGAKYCTYVLKKYFINNGYADIDFTSAKKVFEDRGYVNSNNEASGFGPIYYLPNESAYCSVNIFNKEKKTDFYNTPQKYLGINTSIELKDNEYIYGFDCTREYEYDPNAQ